MWNLALILILRNLCCACGDIGRFLGRSLASDRNSEPQMVARMLLADVLYRKPSKNYELMPQVPFHLADALADPGTGAGGSHTGQIRSFKAPKGRSGGLRWVHRATPHFTVA